MKKRIFGNKKGDASEKKQNIFCELFVGFWFFSKKYFLCRHTMGPRIT
jgi:hypothetical protein